jgi:hypothetical protein
LTSIAAGAPTSGGLDFRWRRHQRKPIGGAGDSVARSSDRPTAARVRDLLATATLMNNNARGNELGIEASDFSDGTSGTWEESQTGGSGSLMITILTATEIKGTCSAMMVVTGADAGTGDAGMLTACSTCRSTNSIS